MDRIAQPIEKNGTPCRSFSTGGTDRSAWVFAGLGKGGVVNLDQLDSPPGKTQNAVRNSMDSCFAGDRYFTGKGKYYWKAAHLYRQVSSVRELRPGAGSGGALRSSASGGFCVKAVR